MQRESQRTARWIYLSWVLAALALGGCGIFAPTPQACTLIACDDSLTIDLVGAVPDEFTVELTASDGTSVQAQCANGEARDPATGELSPRAMCLGDSVAFSDFTPEDVSIRITWQDGEIVEEAQPSYEVVRPNGPDCPPECRQAHVEIEIP